MPIYVPDENGELSALDQTSLNLSESASQVPPGDLGAAFVKMFICLIALVILLFVSYWFIRRMIQNRLQKGVGDAAIQIIEKRMISPKTMLYLIEVDRKRILVAESHLEIKRIAELSVPGSEEPHS
jgi:flagellar biogenesis protein FliO